MRYILLLLITLLTPVRTGAEDWDYDRVYDEELLYLHTLVNYEYDPDWQQSWEKDLMSCTGVRFNFGSVSATRLMHYEDVVINHDLSDGWRFRSTITLNYCRYKDVEENTRYLEFQRKLHGNLFVTVTADVQSDKDNADATVSLLHTDESREQYTQLHFCWDDLVYDARNNNGGVTTRQPFGFKWLSRHAGTKWIFFTHGKLSTGFKREYPDINKSPDSMYHHQRINQAFVRITRLIDEEARIESECSYYNFDESRRYRDTADDYRYSNRIFFTRLRYIFPVRRVWQVNCALLYVNQDADAGILKNYSFHRNEYIPVLFLKRSISDNALKIGYFGSFYDMDFDDSIDANYYDINDYIDKITAGWIHSFSSRAKILLSLSHVVSLKNFGGGNMQFFMNF